VKKSIKAALLFSLVFPGIDHMVLKRYKHGSALLLSALSGFVAEVINQALTIVDRINSGGNTC